MALFDSLDQEIVERVMKDCRKEFENMVQTLITVQPMSGCLFGDAWRVPQGFSYPGVEEPIKMKVLKNRNGRSYANPCNEISIGQPEICSLPYELEDTPEQAYERAMKGI